MSSLLLSSLISSIFFSCMFLFYFAIGGKGDDFAEGTSIGLHYILDRARAIGFLRVRVLRHQELKCGGRGHRDIAIGEASEAEGTMDRRGRRAERSVQRGQGRRQVLPHQDDHSLVRVGC